MDKTTLYQAMQRQKEEMTAEERMAAYLKGEEVDFQPFSLLAPQDALLDVWGYTKGEEYRSFDLRCELIRRRETEWGITGISMDLGLRGLGEAMGSRLGYPEHRTDYVKDHVLNDYDKLDHLMEFSAHDNAVLQARLAETRRMTELFPHMPVTTGIAGPLSSAASIRPIEMILRDFRKRPDELHRLLDLTVTASLEWVEVCCRDAGAVSAGISDPVTTTDIVSGKQFAEFSRPYLKRLVEGIERITGSRPFVHICGHTQQIWEDLTEIGIDNFSLDNCESLRDARATIGDRVFLSGNVAPVEVMHNGSIDDVMQAVKRCLSEGSGSPRGFMLTTGCQVPLGTPEENLKAFIYAARRYGRGARKGQRPRGLLEE